MGKSEEDKTNPLFYIVHRGPEEIDPEAIDLFLVNDPGEEDPVEDTCEIKD